MSALGLQHQQQQKQEQNEPGLEKDKASSDSKITSPLFTSNNPNEEGLPEDESQHHFSSMLADDSGLLPPVEEAPYQVRETRRSVFSATDLDTMLEADFPDAGKNFVKSQEEADAIMREIRSVVLFEGYDDDELRLVVDYMYIRAVHKGDVVIQHGAAGDAFFVVKSGKYQCTVPSITGGQETVRNYNGDGFFGELALINRAPRAATIKAQTDGKLWVLNALRYSWLRKNRAMINAERFERVIKAIPLFRDNLTPKLVNRLIDAIEVVNVPAGHVICKQGDPGDTMYFIMDGEIEALIDEKLVRTMTKNEFFGERALVLDEGRAATCRAAAKSKLAKLPKESFGLLIPDNVVNKMKRHIAVSYGGIKLNSDDYEDDDDDDIELGTVGVHVEQFWQDVQKF